MGDLRIDVDTRTLIAALDAFPGTLAKRLRGEARYTATAIAREMSVRIARRTGKTAGKITVEEARKGDGFVVYVKQPRRHIASFLERGTKKMAARPFFHASAQMEAPGHDRRVRESIREAIAEQGLGE